MEAGQYYFGSAEGNRKDNPQVILVVLVPINQGVGPSRWASIPVLDEFPDHV